MTGGLCQVELVSHCLSETTSQSQVDSRGKETQEEITLSKKPECIGAQQEKQWVSTITHIVLSGPCLWEIIKSISVWYTNCLGKVVGLCVLW